MSTKKSKTKKSETPSDVTPYWVERGYREEIAASPKNPNEDSRGEEAYQRQFYISAQLSPPRLPNPSHYPNSPSACEYIRQRNQKFLPERGEKRQSDASSTSQSVARKFRDPDREASLSDKTSPSTSPASNYSASTIALPSAMLSTPRTMDVPNNPFSSFQPQTLAQIPQSGPRPAPMEPYIAPSGPSKRLR